MRIGKVQVFIRERITSPIVRFLLQGISAKKLALAISFGFVIGTFPVLGTHTILLVIVIFVLRLNAAFVFLAANLIFPFYFVLFIPYLNIGHLVCGEARTGISITLLQSLYQEDLLKCIQYIGKEIIYAIIGWGISSIPACILIYFVLIYIFDKIHLPSLQTLTKNKPI